MDGWVEWVGERVGVAGQTRVCDAIRPDHTVKLGRESPIPSLTPQSINGHRLTYLAKRPPLPVEAAWPAAA